MCVIDRYRHISHLAVCHLEGMVVECPPNWAVSSSRAQTTCASNCHRAALLLGCANCCFHVIILVIPHHVSSLSPICHSLYLGVPLEFPWQVFMSMKMDKLMSIIGTELYLLTLQLLALHLHLPVMHSPALEIPSCRITDYWYGMFGIWYGVAERTIGTIW